MKFLKNYTSEVPISQTLYRIRQVLIKCGVADISEEYDPAGNVTAMRFSIQAGDGLPKMQIRLPADVDKAHQALWLDYVGDDVKKLAENGTMFRSFSGTNKRKTKKDFAEQAGRTAWKIIQDWVEVQMSMIVMQQAEYREVFMPYIWDGKQTLYQRIKEGNGFKALLPEKTGE